jgi:hypothetical protein
MGYTLQGIVGDRSLVGPLLRDMRGVVLPQDKIMIPLHQELRAARGIPLLPFTDEGCLSVPASLAALCRELSANGKVAYLEAEFFGGTGMQAALVANRGDLGKLEVSSHAINMALSVIGVEKGNALDEFDALLLGRARDTNDWLDPKDGRPVD